MTNWVGTDFDFVPYAYSVSFVGKNLNYWQRSFTGFHGAITVEAGCYNLVFDLKDAEKEAIKFASSEEVRKAASWYLGVEKVQVRFKGSDGKSVVVNEWDVIQDPERGKR